MLGHADTRMFETIYARTRKDSILLHRHTVETMNEVCACDTEGDSEPP